METMDFFSWEGTRTGQKLDWHPGWSKSYSRTLPSCWAYSWSQPYWLVSSLVHFFLHLRIFVVAAVSYFVRLFLSVSVCVWFFVCCVVLLVLGFGWLVCLFVFSFCIFGFLSFWSLCNRLFGTRAFSGPACSAQSWQGEQGVVVLVVLRLTWRVCLMLPFLFFEFLLCLCPSLSAT